MCPTYVGHMYPIGLHFTSAHEIYTFYAWKSQICCWLVQKLSYLVWRVLILHAGFKQVETGGVKNVAEVLE